MASSISTLPRKPECEELLQEIGCMKHVFSGLGRLFWMYPKLLFKSKMKLNQVRNYMAACGEERPEVECLVSLCESASFVRDGLQELLEISADVKPLLVFRFFLRNAVSDWDDLVEDCSISLDPEIRGMLCQIANAV